MCCGIFLLLNKKVYKFQLRLKTAVSLFPFSFVTFLIYTGHEVLMEVNVHSALICWQAIRDFGPAADTLLNRLIIY